MLLAVKALASLPAQEEVDRGMRDPLTPDDPLAVVLELARAQVRLEHRRPRLLRLQYERVLPVAADEQEYPGARADAPDADDLPGHVNELVCPEEVAPILVEAGGILIQQLPNVFGLVPGVDRVKQLTEWNQQWGDAAEAQLAVDPLSEFFDRP